MSSRFIVLLLSCVIFSRANAALDLTPATQEFTEDGVAYRVIDLKSGKGSVRFSPPEGWTIRGHKTRLQLNPPKGDFCEGVVEVSAPGSPQVLEEAAIAAFKEQIHATLPAGSYAITTLLEASNTIMPAGRPSFEIVVSYQLWGKIFQRSALLVNGSDERLIFRFTALKEDFNALNGSFRRSMASWQWIEQPTRVAANTPAASK